MLIASDSRFVGSEATSTLSEAEGDRLSKTAPSQARYVRQQYSAVGALKSIDIELSTQKLNVSSATVVFLHQIGYLYVYTRSQAQFLNVGNWKHH